MLVLVFKPWINLWTPSVKYISSVMNSVCALLWWLVVELAPIFIFRALISSSLDLISPSLALISLSLALISFSLALMSLSFIFRSSLNCSTFSPLDAAPPKAHWVSFSFSFSKVTSFNFIKTFSTFNFSISTCTFAASFRNFNSWICWFKSNASFSAFNLFVWIWIFNIFVSSIIMFLLFCFSDVGGEDAALSIIMNPSTLL